MRNQARGLASTVTTSVEEKIVQLKPLWRHAPAGTPGLLRGLQPTSDVLAPPWPDLVVSCGRRAGAIALALKAKSGGRFKLVHVQDPQAAPQGFDLVVAMAHDKVAGPNVLKLETALHDVRPERLEAAARAWAPRLSELPRPYLGVLLGGSTRNVAFGLEEAQRLQVALATLHARTGGSLLIVPSRRTPPAVSRYFQLMAGAAHDVWTWTGEDENPYLGVLALADRLVVTADSISMISEALATTAPVEIFMVPLRERHAHFVRGLFDRALAAPLTGDFRWVGPRPIIDSTAHAAFAVRRLLATDSGG